MSHTHLIELRAVKPGEPIQTGFHAELYLDGKRIESAVGFQLDVPVDGLPIVTLTMIAGVKIDPLLAHIVVEQTKEAEEEAL